ncbi:hypothetical protein ACFXKW_01200 [Streptomyces sp. NPDC059193]|uniref:hypothetical protein n=1 Tax=Streptomyces sp. NPDC059193 TaxID=3346763 RepID=UPI0036C037CB
MAVESTVSALQRERRPRGAAAAGVRTVGGPGCGPVVGEGAEADGEAEAEGEVAEGEVAEGEVAEGEVAAGIGLSSQ